MYEILYVNEVVDEDLPNILDPSKAEIKEAIERKLKSRPEVYSRPLKRSLRGYRKLKVGNFRIVLKIEGAIVKIFVIQHRSIVYITAPKKASNQQSGSTSLL